MLNTIRMLATLALLLAGSLAAAAQDDTLGVPYTRIYTDAQGESHFEDGMLDLEKVALQGGQVHAGLRQFMTDERATLMLLEPGAFEDWHPSPDTQLMVIIQGYSEVGVTDGEVRRFGPGSLILMEDDHGKGHTTATVGDVDHIGLMIPIERE